MFGILASATDLPQLLSNRNPNLNLKPYIKGSAEVVAGTGLMGITPTFSRGRLPGHSKRISYSDVVTSF